MHHRVGLQDIWASHVEWKWGQHGKTGSVSPQGNWLGEAVVWLTCTFSQSRVQNIRYGAAKHHKGPTTSLGRIQSFGKDKESRNQREDSGSGTRTRFGVKDPENGSGSEPQPLWREMIPCSGDDSGSWRRFSVRNCIQSERDSVSCHHHHTTFIITQMAQLNEKLIWRSFVPRSPRVHINAALAKYSWRLERVGIFKLAPSDVGYWLCILFGELQDGRLQFSQVAPML